MRGIVGKHTAGQFSGLVVVILQLGHNRRVRRQRIAAARAASHVARHRVAVVLVEGVNAFGIEKFAAVRKTAEGVRRIGKRQLARLRAGGAEQQDCRFIGGAVVGKIVSDAEKHASVIVRADGGKIHARHRKFGELSALFQIIGHNLHRHAVSLVEFSVFVIGIVELARRFADIRRLHAVVHADRADLPCRGIDAFLRRKGKLRLKAVRRDVVAVQLSAADQLGGFAVLAGILLQNIAVAVEIHLIGQLDVEGLHRLCMRRRRGRRRQGCQ